MIKDCMIVQTRWLIATVSSKAVAAKARDYLRARSLLSQVKPVRRGEVRVEFLVPNRLSTPEAYEVFFGALPDRTPVKDETRTCEAW